MGPRRVTATAPVRVCDVGGWTDTWFAGHGAVCNVAVGPGAQVTVTRRAEGGPATRVVSAWRGHAYDVWAHPVEGWLHPGPGRNPLVEHAVGRHLMAHPADADVGLIVTVEDSVPPGTSLGTSAAVTVAVVGALAALADEPLDAAAVARTAYAIEADDVGRQCGVQDQWAAAWGGVSWIEVPAFPEVTHRRVDVPAAAAAGLAERLVTVAYGGGHDSSTVHEQVIARLEAPGADHRPLDRLRRLAGDAYRALEAGDLDGWGEVLVASTAEQAALHPGLVDRAARAIIEVARREGATGWKVNGAGGPGGSVTMLAADEPGPLERALTALPAVRPLTLTAVAEGLTLAVEG